MHQAIPSVSINSAHQFDSEFWPISNNLQFYQNWFAAQVQVYERQDGWIFWSWKTSGLNDPRWDYQMAVEAFVWRTYEQTLPPDAVELDIDGHRAAQYWIMKPTDWNNRWWITCMIAFKTSYGVIQQSLFYSPVYSEPDPDCMQTNLQRAHELAPYYKF